MAFVKVLVPRTSQPQDGGVGIDWNNPITNGLVDAVPASQLRTVVNRDPATTTGTMSDVVGQKGLARNPGLTGTSGKDAYSGEWSKINAPLTLFTLYQRRATSLATRVSGNLTTSVNGYGFAPNTTNFRAIISRSGVNTILTGATTSNTLLKADAIVIGPTNAELWENGVRTVAPTAHGGMATPTGSFTHGLENSASNCDSMEIYLSVLWKRELSANELESLADNPWQIFEPEEQWIWIPDTASTGATASYTGTTDDSAISGSASSAASASASLTTDSSTVTSSASVSPFAFATLTTSDSAVSSSASVKPLATAALTTADSTASSTAYVIPLASAGLTTDSATITGSAAAGSAIASGAITTDDAFVAALAQVSPLALMAVYTDSSVMAGSASVAGAYWPTPAQVLLGVMYGPTGVEYTGTLTGGTGPTAEDIAAAVWAYTQ